MAPIGRQTQVLTSVQHSTRRSSVLPLALFFPFPLLLIYCPASLARLYFNDRVIILHSLLLPASILDPLRSTKWPIERCGEEMGGGGRRSMTGPSQSLFPFLFPSFFVGTCQINRTLNPTHPTKRPRIHSTLDSSFPRIGRAKKPMRLFPIRKLLE